MRISCSAAVLAATTALVVGTTAAAAATAAIAPPAPGLPALAGIQLLQIAYGANDIPAFTRDGQSALVVKVHHENGNAHSTDQLLIAVRSPSPAPGVAGIPQAVDREAPGAPASDLYVIEPFDGENEVGALQLVRATANGRPETWLLQARRRVADVPALTSPARVDLQVWRLDGPSDDIGRTPYHFVPAGAATTTRLYCNATTALNKELGVPFPDGWDNEDTADGCPPAALRQRTQAALDMAHTLDVTSFANSIGPRHLAAGTTFAAAGFDVVQAFPDGWVQLRLPDGSWQFSLYVLEDAPGHKLVCIGDESLKSGTYRTLQALDVVPALKPDGVGTWHATGRPRAVAGCAS